MISSDDHVSIFIDLKFDSKIFVSGCCRPPFCGMGVRETVRVRESDERNASPRSYYFAPRWARIVVVPPFVVWEWGRQLEWERREECLASLLLFSRWEFLREWERKRQRENNDRYALTCSQRKRREVTSLRFR